MEAMKLQLKTLDIRKQALESEGQAIVQELTTPGEDGGPPMGVDTPLVDRDGFPRGDIDLYRARSCRKRFHEIQTDVKDLQRQIQNGLIQLNMLMNAEEKEANQQEQEARLAEKPKPIFDKASGKWVVTNWDGSTTGGKLAKDSKPSNDETSAPVAPDVQVESQQADSGDSPAFAKIDGVAPESPASQAGLQEGDLITRFGTIFHSNHDNLKALAVIVPEAAADAVALEIEILRKDPASDDMLPHICKIVPRPWGGRGSQC